MRFDLLSLALLNLLALTRVLSTDPALTEIAAALFLLRITMVMRDAAFVVDGRQPELGERSGVPVTRT